MSNIVEKSTEATATQTGAYANCDNMQVYEDTLVAGGSDTLDFVTDAGAKSVYTRIENAGSNDMLVKLTTGGTNYGKNMTFSAGRVIEFNGPRIDSMIISSVAGTDYVVWAIPQA